MYISCVCVCVCIVHVCMYCLYVCLCIVCKCCVYVMMCVMCVCVMCACRLCVFAPCVSVCDSACACVLVLGDIPKIPYTRVYIKINTASFFANTEIP